MLAMNRSSIVRLSLSVLVVLLAPAVVFANRDGDQSIDPPAEIMNEPSPVLSPLEALKAFEIEEGFEIQLVASEPMVVDPVCMAWDDQGRLWVAEMTTYMADQYANGEEQPKGNIVVLEDLNGDGVFDEKNDKRTVFLDKIILPRTIAFAKGGLLYADYQKLYFVKINSNGKAGFKQVIDAGYSDDGNAKSNVEHQANGMLYGLDNFYYNAKSTRRYKQIGARFRTDKATERNPAGGTEFRGQWGISQDDDGRILTNRNPTLIEYELLPPSVTRRNPNIKFKNPLIKVSNKVWPSHPTPGVNRAYQPKTVDHETWKLKVATAACGPVIYRGTQFPDEYYNNVFVPEPAGNLVKRIVLGTDDDGKPTAEFAYEGKEFLTSTDERNRFVNSYTGPDGALYLVDFYRGLIQHQTYISEYLRRQINARELDKPIGLGRIYRVVHKESPIDHTPVNLSVMSSVELVELLGHTNAWHRHNAQRLLVQRRDSKSVEPLIAMATTSDKPQARIHALWTLEGMRKLDAETLYAAGESYDQRVRAQVVRLSENFAGEEEAGSFVDLMASYGKETPNWALDMQLALSAGILADIENPKAYDVLHGVLQRRGDDNLFNRAVISGLRGKEAVMLAKVENGPIKKMLTDALAKATESGDLTIESLLTLVDSQGFDDQRNDILTNLADKAVEQDLIVVVDELVKKLASDNYTEDNKLAILTGMVRGSEKRTNPVGLDGKPDVFTALQDNAPDALADHVAKLDEIFVYERAILDAATLARIEKGGLLYGAHCSTCHGQDGTGLEGAGPPLAPSDWVNASEKMLATLLLVGVKGDITVNGKLYTPPSIQTEMPGFKNSDMTDQDLADILTFIRSKEFNNTSPAVDAQVITDARAQFVNQNEPLHTSVLWQIHLDDGGEDMVRPAAKITQASWLKNTNANLVITLVAVTVPLIMLLVGTLFGSMLPKP